MLWKIMVAVFGLLWRLAWEAFFVIVFIATLSFLFAAINLFRPGFLDEAQALMREHPDASGFIVLLLLISLIAVRYFKLIPLLKDAQRFQWAHPSQHPLLKGRGAIGLDRLRPAVVVSNADPASSAPPQDSTSAIRDELPNELAAQSSPQRRMQAKKGKK
jgi:hypothetical protein